MIRQIGTLVALLALARAAAGAGAGTDEVPLQITGAGAPEQPTRTLTLNFNDARQRKLKDILVQREDDAKDGPRVQWDKDLPDRKLTVRFIDIAKPGQYKASFKLQGVFDDGTRTAVSLPAMVELAVGPPQVELSTKALNFAVARCGADCWASEWLAPEITRREARFEVKNLSPHDVVVTPSFEASGLVPLDWKSGVKITSDTATIERQRTAWFTVKLPPDEPVWTSGKHSGKVLLAARQADMPRVYGPQDGKLSVLNEAVHAVDVEIRVRDSVGWALTVALLGVLMGRLLQSMNSDIYRQRTALMVRLNALVRRIEALPNAGLLEGLRAMVEQQRARVDIAPASELTDEAGLLEKLFDAAMGLCMAISRIQQMEPKPDGAGQEIDKLEAAIKTIIEKRDPNGAAAALQAANAYLGGHKEPPVQSALVLEAADTTPPPGLLAQAGAFTSLWLGKAGSLTSRGLAILAGTESPSVGLAVRLIQPLLTILLLALLTLYGVWLVYSGDTESAQTFGAQGIAAYVSLFLWGLTAQVISRTLQTLSFSRAG